MTRYARTDLQGIFEAAGRRGFAYAWQMLRNREDALDAVQAALASVWQHRGRLDPARDPRGWFYRILRNRCLDILRSRRRRVAVELDGDPPATDSRDPLQHLSDNELQQRLRHALAELPPEQREIVLLRDYHDLAYADIAQTLDIPTGTVMSRLHRARTALRERLQTGVQP